MISITIKSLVLISGLTYKSTRFFRWCSRFVQEPLYVECFRCNAINLWIQISPTILNKPLIIRLGRKPSFSYYIRSLGKERLTWPSSSSSFFSSFLSCRSSHAAVLQTALLNILIAFPLSSVVTFHCIASIACQWASFVYHTSWWIWMICYIFALSFSVW